MKRFLTSVVGVLAVGTMAMAQGPTCTVGDGFLAFAPYDGSGGNFTLTVMFDDGTECDVKTQLPAGLSSPWDLNDLFIASNDRFCIEIGRGANYPANPRFGQELCLSADDPITTNSGAKVLAIQARSVPGHCSGFAIGIAQSEFMSVARFDVEGMPTAGMIEVTVGPMTLRTSTQGKSLERVRHDIMMGLVSFGSAAFMEPTGQFRLPFQRTSDGIAIVCTDMGLTVTASFGVDTDIDGIEDMLDCQADITSRISGMPDGNVDAMDFLALFNDWGPCSSRHCPGDIVYDGTVDALDFLALLDQWGTPGSCAHEPLPE